jgi:hypothetical protein
MSSLIMNKSKVKPTFNWMEHRGWETVFFFSEAVMIVFYCVGTTYSKGTHTYDIDPAVIAVQQ